MLKAFGPELFVADGPTVPFFGFPYPTRMAIAVLANGDLWVWSPVALNSDLAREVDALGPVRHIVSPNKIHHLFMAAWQERWPDAALYAPPGLARKRPDLQFVAKLTEQPPDAWATDIDQAVFRGSFAMEEVAFFHKPSKTAIVGDLIQRHPPEKLAGWKGWLMRLDGLVGRHGSTPREWRATFLRPGPARAAREKVLGWNAERLLIAHGDCAQTGATAILADALRWI